MGGKHPEPIKKIYDLKKLPELHKTQEKSMKKIFHVMFSAGQYRSTEKCYEILYVSENIIFYNLSLTAFCY